MELSAENIEDLAIAMTGNAPTIGSMGGDVFENKCDFSNLDVNQANISDPQDYLYDTQIELARPSSTSCSLNDILDDICEMSKTIELNQAAVNASNSQFPYTTTTDHLPMESPVFYNLPEMGIQQGDYTADSNFSNQANYLQPLGQWSEYLSTLPPALENLQDVPQLTTVQATPPPPLPDYTVPQSTPTDEATINVNINIDENQLVSAPAVPLQLYNNFHFNFPASESPQFFQPIDKNVVLPPQKRQRMQKQIPCFGWARVVPRKAFVQPAEVMILRPLRTRKVASSRQNFDLSAYFDTSAISIPMIRERPRCKNANRRKQKLHTIPGSENMIFEIDIPLPVEDKDDHTHKESKFIDANNNADKLYAEAEIPELDEIFKRKRRGPTIRRNPRTANQVQTPTSDSSKDEDDEEKESVASPTQDLIKKETIEVIGSNSDVDSDDTPLNAVKSMKCQSCKKYFKTSRSLKIHLKRCEAVPRTPGNELLQVCEKMEPAQKISAPDKTCKETASQKTEDGKQNQSARPLTRSQTGATKRKSAGSRNNVASKRKC